MEWLLIGSVLILVAALALAVRVVVKRIDSRELPPPLAIPPPQVNVNLSPLEDAIRAVPTKVLQSIQSSTNTKKGALGELVGYIQLEAEYDRIVPLGNIVDFMCIKFPKSLPDGTIDMGQVDFVDIKTGKSSRLSKDQRELQKLIKDKRVNFVKLKVDTQSSAGESDED